jgi:AcrR family transcriptional regulator
MESPPSDELPPPFDLLWGRRDRQLRPRKQGLSVERVVGAAVELADADGLEAVSMSRVAERLGFTTMSLYRHVRSKDELVGLMVEAAVGTPTKRTEGSPDGWRSGLERWSRDLLAVVQRHPWLLAVSLASMPLGPNRLTWLDSGLEALAGTALSWDDKAAVTLLLNGFVFTEARTAAELAGPARDGSPAAATAAMPHALSALVDAERFPALRRALDAGIFEPSESDRDADFAFGLERILDGVERLVTQRAGDEGQ